MLKAQVNLRSSTFFAMNESTISIGELAERAGVPHSALRFYEAQGLLKSARSAGGQRRYARDVLRRVAFIRSAQNVGLRLEDIASALAQLPESRTPTRASTRSKRCAISSISASVAAVCRSPPVSCTTRPTRPQGGVADRATCSAIHGQSHELIGGLTAIGLFSMASSSPQTGIQTRQNSSSPLPRRSRHDSGFPALPGLTPLCVRLKIGDLIRDNSANMTTEITHLFHHAQHTRAVAAMIYN